MVKEGQRDCGGSRNHSNQEAKTPDVNMRNPHLSLGRPDTDVEKALRSMVLRRLAVSALDRVF